MFQNYKVAYARKHIKVREARKLSFLRQSVAFMLAESARQIPHASMVSPFDITSLVEFGKKTGNEIREDADTGSEKALFKRAIRNHGESMAKMFDAPDDIEGFRDWLLDFFPAGGEMNEPEVIRCDEEELAVRLPITGGKIVNLL